MRVSEVRALLEELKVWVGAPAWRPPWTPTSTVKQKVYLAITRFRSLLLIPQSNGHADKH